MRRAGWQLTTLIAPDSLTVIAFGYWPRSATAERGEEKLRAVGAEDRPQVD